MLFIQYDQLPKVATAAVRAAVVSVQQQRCCWYTVLYIRTAVRYVLRGAYSVFSVLGKTLSRGTGPCLVISNLGIQPRWYYSVLLELSRCTLELLLFDDVLRICAGLYCCNGVLSYFVLCTWYSCTQRHPAYPGSRVHIVSCSITYGIA